MNSPTLTLKVIISRSGLTRTDFLYLDETQIAKWELPNTSPKLNKLQVRESYPEVITGSSRNKIIEKFFSDDPMHFIFDQVNYIDELNYDLCLKFLREQQQDASDYFNLIEEDIAEAINLKKMRKRFLQERWWTSAVQGGAEVIGLLSGGGNERTGSGQKLIIGIGNGRHFKITNTYNAISGVIKKHFVTTSQYDVGVDWQNLGTKAVITNSSTDAALKRMINLSDAAGDHRILDPLVSGGEPRPNTGTIAGYVNTKYSAWKKFKVLYRTGQDDDETLFELFRLFNLCTRTK